MPTINNLTRASSINFGDVLPAYIQSQGDARGISVSDLLEFIQDNITFPPTINLGAPVTKTASFTLANTENWIICAGTGAMVATLPAPGLNPGRQLTFKNTAAFAVSSASANIVPLSGAAPTTSILAASTGKYCVLVSDGANWVTMISN